MLSFKDTQKLESIKPLLNKKILAYINQFPSLYIAYIKSEQSIWMLAYLANRAKKELTSKIDKILMLRFIEYAYSESNDVLIQNSINIIKQYIENKISKEGVDDFMLKSNFDDSKPASIYKCLYFLSSKPNSYRGSYYIGYQISVKESADKRKDVEQFQSNTIRELVPNPFILEADRLGLDQATADPWKDILEDI